MPETSDVTSRDSMPKGVVPRGRYAQGGRSPIVYVFLCPPCAGYAPISAPGYEGFLSGRCQGCGGYSRELHRFPAVIHSAGSCQCESSHRRVTGDLPASAGRYAWKLVPPPDDPDLAGAT